MQNTVEPIILNREQIKSTAVNLISDSLEYYDANTEKYMDYSYHTKSGYIY